MVTFNCGGPATFDVTGDGATGTKIITGDATIDGGNLITIRGGDPAFYVVAGVELTVQNLTLASPRSCTWSR